MLFVLALGLACLFAPGAIMAVAGLSAHAEEDAGLVWIFRVLGFVLVGVWLYFGYLRGGGR